MRQAKEIYALNYSIWHFMRDAARDDFCKTAQTFSLPEDSLEAISRLDDGRLGRLCSETLVFFAPKERMALTRQEATPIQTRFNSLSGGATAFTQLWWLSLGKMAANDPWMSAQAFGISIEFANAVAAMPTQHLWHLSAANNITFRLRFDPRHISSILSERNVPTNLFLKIHQQALSHSV